MMELKLSKPLKYDHPKGTPVTVVDQYINESTGEKIWFTAPKIDGVYYGKAVKFFENTVKLKNKVFNGKGPINSKDPSQGNAFINKEDVFEFFTEACSGIMLLFAATESLANSLIENAPEYNYYNKKKVNIFSVGNYFVSRKNNAVLSLEQLLFLSIEEKLKKVLPCLYKFESPASKIFWQDFKTLKLLRDGFIHCTRNQAYGANRGVNSLYSQLFDINFEKFAYKIGDLLIYLQNNSQKTV